MKPQRNLESRILCVAALVFAGCCLAGPAAQAQCTGTGVAGNNAIYCGTATQGSAAYIDASAVTLGSDFCKTLNNIIVANTGVVIDARGLTSQTTCVAGSTPWVQGTGSSPTVTPHAATILLPPGTLTIATTWIIPGSSKLIGEGPGVTTIKAASTFAADGLDSIPAVVEMGSQNTTTPSMCVVNLAGNVDCVGVGVQDLTVDMSSLQSAVYGIYNAASQETSFVDNVNFINVGNSTNSTVGKYAALEVATVTGPSASNSGPYSNLVCTLTSTAYSTTRCVDLLGHTRGIHGMSCYGGGTSAQTAAIYLDSDANSIEDVYVNGFANGIYIGSQGQAPSNVLFNITGGTSITSLINIDSAITSSTSFCPPTVTGGQNVCDLTIMGVGAATGTTAIDDQVTGASLTASGGDGFVGLYMLGDQVGSAATPVQYSRFSTSPRVPTWLFGSGVASGTCTPNGALYSNTSTTGSTLFACINGTWTSIP